MQVQLEKIPQFLKENGQFCHWKYELRDGNQTVYSRYETGKNDMKPSQIIALCEYYKVSADYVLGLPQGRAYGFSKTRSPHSEP